MPFNATYIGIDKILNGFENKADTPYFSLWVGKARAEMNRDNDFDKAKDKLERQIKEFIDADMNDGFVIALHPEKKVSYKYEDCKDATLMYCQTKKADIGYHYGQNQNKDFVTMELMQKLNAIESKVNALEADDVDDENEQVSGTDEAAILDKINGIVNSPVVSMILGFLNKNNTATALAGTVDQDELSSILTTLFSKGVTVQHLKKLSEYPENKIKMLLSMM